MKVLAIESIIKPLMTKEVPDTCERMPIGPLAPLGLLLQAA